MIKAKSSINGELYIIGPLTAKAPDQKKNKLMRHTSYIKCPQFRCPIIHWEMH